MAKVITFGCRLNFYESNLIENFLDSHDSEEFVVINTCAVTNEAERKVKQRIRRCHREEPNKKIIVVGCGVQLSPLTYADMPGVFKVLGNVEKLKIKNYVSAQKVVVTDPSEVSDITASNVVPVSTIRARAFLEIQNGCDHDCTFCAVTFSRGRNRSVDAKVIVSEIRRMVDNGIKEVVLTGVDITDYGKDVCGKPSLTPLLKTILDSVPELMRLRLSSVDVAELNDDFIEFFASESRVMPHLHLSLQSGDPIILKRMKRRHNPEQIVQFHSRVSALRPDTVFGADMIAGFPTETEEMFLNSYQLIEELAIPYLHVFPFSPKKGTKAALMPQLESGIPKRRAKQLIEVGKKNLQRLHDAQIGSVHNVVLERDDIGRSENFCLVKLDRSVKDGGVISVKITGRGDAETLEGQVMA